MRKFIFYSFLIVFLAGLGAAYFGYKAIFAPNVKELEEAPTIVIPTDSGFSQVKEELEKLDILQSINSFVWVSKLMHYQKDLVPPGQYKIKPGWSNRELISQLRSGNQSPVQVTFNNVRTLEELSVKLSKNIELDSNKLKTLLLDKEIQGKYGFNMETFMTMFIPNTYQFYWNVSGNELLDRISKEYESFWSKSNRRQKAKALGLTPDQVYTLASIVEKESLKKDEQKTIAGVYLNRLEKGMLLQADPTVVFAVGDFSIRRVLNKHLSYESPYNTYLNPGLPPGPIAMPSISAIDAVLNYEKHNYIYFCAKPESGGRHAFAENISQHNQNARIYRQWLDANKIR